MNKTDLLTLCRQEESIAHIHGWDFSHLAGRYTEEEDLPWDYRAQVLGHLTPTSRVLDIDTGGGEFLLSLGHPPHLLAATEGYPPNAALCREVLTPLGVDFRAADGTAPMPWPDKTFDLVLNRHGDFHPADIHRILKPGGVFLTQQVGAENDRELVELLLDPPPPLPFPEQYLHKVRAQFERAGFTTLAAQEAFRPIRFFDVGALTWFARIIEWEFPGFSVDACQAQLLHAQRLLEQHGAIQGRIHRFLLIARK